MLGGAYPWSPPTACLLPSRHGLRLPLPTRLIMRKSLIQHLEQRGVQVRLEGQALSKWVGPAKVLPPTNLSPGSLSLLICEVGVTVYLTSTSSWFGKCSPLSS